MRGIERERKGERNRAYRKMIHRGRHRERKRET